MTTDLRKEVVNQVVFSLPSVWTVANYLTGISLNQWVGISSILYCSLQSIYLIWKWYKEIRKKTNEQL